MRNYFGLTIFSLFKEYFNAVEEKKQQELELKKQLENPAPPPPPVEVPPAIPNTNFDPNNPQSAFPPLPPIPTVPNPNMPIPPPLPAYPPIAPLPMNDKPVNVGANIKVINPSDEYGNYNQLGIVSNVLDPRREEMAAGITQKKYFVKMPDGKTYPYNRSEVEIFN